MNHNLLTQDTVIIDCLTCNQIREDSYPEISACDACGDPYFITES